MTERLTPTEIETEWNYRYQEYLGIMCGAADPTPSQAAIARAEADRWRVEWKEQERNQ